MKYRDYYWFNTKSHLIDFQSIMWFGTESAF
jgi:hypothetical protein